MYEYNQHIMYTMIQFNRLLHSKLGRVFMSIVLGLGLASLFRKVCNDKNCIHFKGPLVKEIDGKTFKHGEGCYKYTVQPASKCDKMKKVVSLATPDEIKIPDVPGETATSSAKPEEVKNEPPKSKLFGIF